MYIILIMVQIEGGTSLCNFVHAHVCQFTVGTCTYVFVLSTSNDHIIIIFVYICQCRAIHGHCLKLMHFFFLDVPLRDSASVSCGRL